MSKSRLTERRIRNLKAAPGKTTFHWDAGISGFGLRVSKGGVKAFILWVRSDGRKRLLTLGRWPELSLDAARAAAASELSQIERGGADLIVRRAEAQAAMTVSDGCKWFLETHVPRRQGLNKMAASTAKNYRHQIARHIVPAIGRQKIEAVRRQDVETMLDGIGWHKAAQFSRVRALVRSLFNCFEVEGWRREGTNPGRRITTPTERARTRILTADEESAFLAALARMADDAAVPVIRFLHATGCRLNEARTLRWDFINHETCNIVLPETKTGEKVIRATTETMSIVSGCARIHGNPFVFAGRGGAVPLGERAIRTAFNKAAKLAGLFDLRPHDLRRSYITDAIAEGVPLTTVADLVGHASIVMTARYAKAADGKIREAAETLAAARRKRQGAEIVAIGERRA